MSGAGLIYLVGASGVGKDSVLAQLRTQLQPDERIVVAHRYITRPVSAGGENHVALSPAEFAQRQAAGCFALAWESHGLCYGIGSEIDLWLAQGLQVVVNGSRAHVPQLLSRYPAARIVAVTASEAVLRARLCSRGRESAAQIEARLAHHRAQPPCPAHLWLNNDGCLEETVASLRGWVVGTRAGLLSSNANEAR